MSKINKSQEENLPELKPCPFCKKHPALRCEHTAMTDEPYYYVECNNPKCLLNISTLTTKTAKAAIDIWNEQ